MPLKAYTLHEPGNPLDGIALTNGTRTSIHGIEVIEFAPISLRGKYYRPALKLAGRPDLLAAYEDAETERRQAEAEYNRPEWIEHRKISRLFVSAENLQGYPADYFPKLASAKAALASWREKYPAAARAERKADLATAAAHQRHLAAGALTYDADGWIDAAAQQRRHDEFLAEAKRLEAEAGKI